MPYAWFDIFGFRLYFSGSTKTFFGDIGGLTNPNGKQKQPHTNKAKINRDELFIVFCHFERGISPPICSTRREWEREQESERAARGEVNVFPKSGWKSGVVLHIQDVTFSFFIFDNHIFSTLKRVLRHFCAATFFPPWDFQTISFYHCEKWFYNCLCHNSKEKLKQLVNKETHFFVWIDEFVLLIWLERSQLLIFFFIFFGNTEVERFRRVSVCLLSSSSSSNLAFGSTAR